MAKRKTATAARDTRPDLATGYDEKVSEARGILKDLNVELREGRELLRTIKEETKEIQDRFVAEMNEVVDRCRESYSAAFHEAGQKLANRKADEVLQALEQLQEEVARRQSEQTKEWFDRLTLAVATGVYDASIEDTIQLTREQLRAWTVKMAAEASGKRENVSPVTARSARNWLAGAMERLPQMHSHLDAFIPSSEERDAAIQVRDRDFPIKFEIFDKNTGAVYHSSILRTMADASAEHAISVPKTANVAHRFTTDTGRVVVRDDYSD